MFAKYLYLGAALAFAALLSFTHLSAFRAGKANVRAEWTLSVAQANADARKLEQQRQRRADEAQIIAAKRASADRARALDAERAAGELRSTLDATERHAKESVTAAAATVSAYRSVFESCVAEYRSMGQEAAGHARDSLMYQQAWPQ